MNRLATCLILGTLFMGLEIGEAHGDGGSTLRALPKGTLPKDHRLGALKTLDDYFPFTPPRNKDEWDARAERVRRQILVSQGLWPMPERTPLNAVVHGKLDRGDYSVEKVYFESYPGHFVTGSLYRPHVGAGPRPAVLCPHGHWANGRFYDVGDRALREQIVNGEERFLVGGRSPLQSRCVQLARMGCVVFHYDMVGYADSVQIAHRPDVRPQMNTQENWGFFSPQAELRLQNMMGLQTYNSICALDFLSSLPDVDPHRIAVTGASGGGTQTFILCAIDPRPAVAFPAVMVSTAMQGGCTCENASCLRVGTGNIEFAALFAPKPLGMTAANDWTVDILTKGYPELKRHYALQGAEDKVLARALPQFGHNYNYVSRAVMYSWLNQHLGLGFEGPILENDYVPLTPAEMSVWDADHPRPPRGDDYERSLLRQLTRGSDSQMAALRPHDAASLAEYRRVVGGALDVIVGRGLPAKDAISREVVTKEDRGDYFAFSVLLNYAAEGEQVPAVFFHPKNWNGEVVVWVDGEGKRALYDEEGHPRDAVRELLQDGTSVAGLDLLYQGESLADGQPLRETRVVGRTENYPNPYAGYTFGYNHSVFAQRVHDVLTMIAFIRDSDQGAKQIHLAGKNGAGSIAAVAAAVAGDTLAEISIDTQGFRFADLDRTTDPNFLPGIVKYGDLPGVLALLAGRDLTLQGEGAVPTLVAQAFAVGGGSVKIADGQ